MHRRPLLDLLDAYLASPRCTDRERPEVNRLADFVRREPACFERSTVEGHITGSAWILNAARDACLLTHHKKLGLWLQPGGHADGQADVVEVALREGREESGIPALEPLSRQIFDVDIHEIPARKAEPAHLHYDVRFALIAPAGATYVVSEESHDLAWVERGGLAAYNTDDSVVRLADKWAP